MSLARPESERLGDLLHAQFSGTADAAQFRELDAILLRSAEARALYLQAAHLHAHLTLRGRRSDAAVREDLTDPTPPRRRRTTPTWVVRTAAAAVIVLAFTVAIAWLVQLAWQRHRSATAGAVVATLIDANNPVWASGSPGPRVGDPMAAGFVGLRSGSATVEFLSGARVTLSGPCEFGLNSARRGFLRRGRVRAYVPGPAHGFTVAAEGLAVVDLGTAFEMNVDDHGPAVRVIQGTVALIPEDDPDLTPGRRVRLVAGESARLDARQLVVNRNAAEPAVPIAVTKAGFTVRTMTARTLPGRNDDPFEHLDRGTLTLDRDATVAHVRVLDFHARGHGGNFPGLPASASPLNLMLRATASLHVGRKGFYTWQLTRDDWAAVWIDGKEVPLKPTGAAKVCRGSMFLDAGDHTLKIDYWNGPGVAALSLRVAEGERPADGSFERLGPSDAMTTHAAPATPADTQQGPQGHDKGDPR